MGGWAIEMMRSAPQRNRCKRLWIFRIVFFFPSLVIESTEYGMSNLGQLFTIQPQKGNLSPNDRPTQVQIVFHSKKEVKIEDKPVLQCHVRPLGVTGWKEGCSASIRANKVGASHRPEPLLLLALGDWAFPLWGGGDHRHHPYPIVSAVLIQQVQYCPSIRH